MTLDERIKKDLTELYEGKEISSAVELKDFIEVSAKGLPQHFVGDRKAKTVFVQLNPGQDVVLADKAYRCLTLDFDKTNVEKFIESYKKAKEEFGEEDKDRLDSFDVKQAAFLKHFDDCGVDIPAEFPENTSKEVLLLAKKNVIMQKLQLELIPYSSSRFNVSKKNVVKIQPFFETILDEIFRINRNYVIFGGSIFTNLFEKIESNDYEIKLEEKKEINLVKNPCTVQIVHITKNNETVHGVIARTFARQDIGRAYKVMTDYGKFCFEELKKSMEK